MTTNKTEPQKKTTQIFSFQVVMLVHVIADDEKEARTQLDEKGGIVTKRDVELRSTSLLYGEKEND